MKKSSVGHVLESYIWLVNTIARGPISRAMINEKWANASVNDYQQDYIPESNFHRWRTNVEQLFNITIKCNAAGEYYIEDADYLHGADMRSRMFNLMYINNLLKDSKDLHNQILFEAISSGEKFLPPIIEALRDKCVLEMTYQSFAKDHPSTFLVEPYCLKMFKQRWYMLAYSPDLAQLHIYALDRIHAIEPTNQKYQLPEEFDAEAYFKNTYGVSGMEKKPEIVEIRIEAYQANYLRTLPIHSSQEEVERDENFSVFRFKVVPSFEFMQELRKHGSLLKVLKPQWLREQFRREAEQLVAMYQK